MSLINVGFKKVAANGQGLGLYGNCSCVRPPENDNKETKLLM